MKFVIKRSGDKFALYSVARTGFGGDAESWIAEHKDKSSLADIAERIATAAKENYTIKFEEA